MAEYNFTFKVATPNYEVMVDPSEWYGYFEHNTRGEDSAGGLWFESTDDDNKLHLIDYDGVFELPKEVIACLREHGFVVGEDFE